MRNLVATKDVPDTPLGKIRGGGYLLRERDVGEEEEEEEEEKTTGRDKGHSVQEEARIERTERSKLASR